MDSTGMAGSGMEADALFIHRRKIYFSRKKAQNHHVVFCLFMANAVWPTPFPKIIDFPGGHAYYLCGLEIDPQVNSSQTRPR